ncbi:DUF2335 domain-containing protein [Nostoc sp. WHI]|uniref:DUF2335 domain-containing protein n=1 Tax=Nostoc sp. WHI TaxID=2650611 RepID=UPI0018C5C8C5|nr:DUF2335 domain-containing protein [Nostoc sp. WHI]MBG1268293.1 DUF2335 domain-containing protein [Nostoc sp. WHI]
MDNEDINETPSEKLDKNLAKKSDLEKMFIGLQTAVISTKSSGPLPPPEILKAYDLVKPGLASEIFDMAKKQSQHRMEMEKTVIGGDSKRSWVGLIFAFIISVVAIGAGWSLIEQGHDLAGSAIAGAPIVSIITAFIYGTNQRSRERAEKQKALLEASTDDEQK